jgi:D-beta-D-heptose 7-phosphate kinase/D-beta-D-heptose 1-phosphate adenosyltransferase
MAGSRVAVVGDLMLDRYYWGQVERISPEAPVPVVAIEQTNERPGGSANVAWNLVELGLSVRLAGVLGKDAGGRRIRSILDDRAIPSSLCITDSTRVTTEKMRIVAHNQQVVRADFESNEEISPRALGRLLSAVEKAVRGVDAVVVSDYGKGVVCEPVMALLRSRCAEKGVPVLVDPKEGHFSLYHGAFAVTPNRIEAGGFYNMKIRTEEDLERVGRALLGDLDAHAVLITLGEGGMTLFERGRRARNFPARASEVYDVTGAGDTVIGVLAAGIAAGASLHESIELANAAAGVVVRELGTAAASPKELIGAFPA